MRGHVLDALAVDIDVAPITQAREIFRTRERAPFGCNDVLGLHRPLFLAHAAPWHSRSLVSMRRPLLDQPRSVFPATRFIGAVDNAEPGCYLFSARRLLNPPTEPIDAALVPLLVWRPPARASTLAGSQGTPRGGARAWKSSSSSSSTASRSVRSMASSPLATRWSSASLAWVSLPMAMYSWSPPSSRSLLSCF